MDKIYTVCIVFSDGLGIEDIPKPEFNCLIFEVFKKSIKREECKLLPLSFSECKVSSGTSTDPTNSRDKSKVHFGMRVIIVFFNMMKIFLGNPHQTNVCGKCLTSIGKGETFTRHKQLSLLNEHCNMEFTVKFSTKWKEGEKEIPIKFKT